MATGGSSSPSSVTVDDPTSTYSNPTRSPSGVTVFSTTSGLSTPTYAAFTTPVAAIRLTMNALSSAGGKPSDTSLAFAAILRAKSRSLLT
ncbi:hypothetical protein [Bradyrhizobium sp. AZCC 2289]|uniref:hypothetical protein n=1 Tax=Bradyrhizobium sp. AZCC 2289 TaxID=3117026 RepID=UPI002FF35F79